MMKEQKETVGLAPSARDMKGNQYTGKELVEVSGKPSPPSLLAAGIDMNLAHRIIRINQTINTATIPIAIMVVIQSIAIHPSQKEEIGCDAFCSLSRVATVALSMISPKQ